MGIQGNWDRRISRRSFIGLGGMSAVALAFGAGSLGAGSKGGSAGFGPLVEDKGGILDLPRGFQYRIVSGQGTNLSSGKPVPGDHDGMAAFQGPGNSTILVRNHELSPGDIAGDDAPVVGENPYDPTQPGGTTGIVIGPDRKEVRDYVTSSGTNRNCSGGPTPWGTWITCEETRIRAGEGGTNMAHGYCFEVLPDGSQTLSNKPIKDMGFFSHEAIGVDPRTGIAYLTEDDFRLPIPDDPNAENEATNRSSFLYRFIPNARNLGPGAYQKGGKLQALSIEEMSNYNADLAERGQRFGVVWRDVRPEFAHTDALAKDCARFNRLEGANFSGGAFWFDDTAGGEERLGQIWRYTPATETLELFFEGRNANNMESPDNLVVAPFGDVWFCEDGSGTDRVMGITPEGEVYEFAKNRLNDSELAGCTFAPDGKTFFVNIQNPGLTFVIWGPFGRVNRNRQRQMAHAAPPRQLAPQVSGELAEAADKHGLSPWEAAGYERLGFSLA